MSADFNHDNRLDLAVSHFGSSSISIFLGNGSGGFTPQGSFSSGGSGPDFFALTVGDFNEDTHPDLVVTNYTSNNVVAFFGTGTGTFSAPSALPSSGDGNPLGVAVGDFNNDNHQDLAVAFYGSFVVRLYLGSGSGTFTLGTAMPTGSGATFPVGIVVGDWNGDGKADLAVSNTNSSLNSIGILLGNGVGGLSPSTTVSSGGVEPFGLVSADFNQDGRADLAVANRSSDTVVVLTNNGLGTFTTASLSSGGDAPHALVVGDFDGNGFPDLASGNYSPFFSLIGALLNTTSPHGIRSFTSPGGMLFDIQARSRNAGQLLQGSGNSFDGLNRLQINGANFGPAGLMNASYDYGRTFTTGTQSISGLSVFREVTVPNAGPQDFARTIDVFANPTGSPITTTIKIVGNLGSDGATTVFATSDGDLTVEPTDLWFGTDDGDGSGAGLLKTNAVFNYEAKNSYSIRVRSTDLGGLSVEKQLTITIENALERTVPVQIGDGTVQRSVVNKLVVSFDHVIEFDAGAFQVFQRVKDSNNALVLVPVTTNVTLAATAGGMTATLTFSGAFTRAGTNALVDGNYQLTINGGLIRILNTTKTFDADGDGNGGGLYALGTQAADNFFALLGDANGNGEVDAQDLLGAKLALRKTIGQSGYNSAYDVNGNGVIDAQDILNIQLNLRKKRVFF